MRQAHPRTCYLCGGGGATSKDHVPPKSLLPKGDLGATPRLTLLTHRRCNEAYSRDEEYFRDIIGPTASEYVDGADTHWSAHRAWERPQGKLRLKAILKDAARVQFRSHAGLYVGRAVGIFPDESRIKRVVAKIARGIMFHDTGNCAAPEVTCIYIPTREVPAEKARELKIGNPYWSLLSSEHCLHDNFSASVAVRRAYTPVRVDPTLACMCCMIVMIYAASFIVMSELTFHQVPRGFMMIAFPDPVPASENAENENPFDPKDRCG